MGEKEELARSIASELTTHFAAIQKEVAGCGFFQLYHRRILYPAVSPTAAASDTIFTEYFCLPNKTQFASVVTLTSVPVIHLGMPCTNWSGRKSEVWTI